MEKRILVCTDGSPASRDALEYIGSLLGKGAEVKVDLLHILPDVPPLFLEPGENMAEMVQLQDFSERVQEENRQKASRIMDEARRILTDAGMAPANIFPLIREPSMRVAQDILDIEQEQAHDAIVLGRHGVSALEEFFMGSVTLKVLHHAKGLPVCVVHGKTDSRRLLVPVVSSPNSKRVLDHVAWLASKAGLLEVTVLHVVLPLIPGEMTSMWTGLGEMETTVEQRVLADAEDMLSQAKTYLIEHGVPAFAIETRLDDRAANVGGSILKQAREGGYGSIIIGRRGISRAKQFLFGSVSNKVVQHAKDMAVWVIS
ncbi:MAG: universal stress protein [Deltaproteobacteria bacterium]|nr:universal stress protein [Deltaproteobacteria bacterium]